MNPTGFLFRLLLVGGALLGTAHAQLVHLVGTQQLEGGGGLIFRANDASIPWNHSGGFISRLDLYYDPSDAVGSEGYYTFSNPDRNVWRIKVHAYGGLGDFELTRPLQFMAFNETAVFFEYDGPDFVEFDFRFEFANPPADPSTLIPPFEFSSASYYLHAGRTVFDIPNLSEGYGGAVFENATGRLAQSVDFTPVPEPSTYAAGAVALVGLALWHRRRRVLTATPPPLVS